MNIKEMKSIIAKEFGVNSFASPLGTCKEYFLNDKILQVAVKNNFPPAIIDKFKNNPYRFGQCQKFDNGTLSGRHFISLLENEILI